MLTANADIPQKQQQQQQQQISSTSFPTEGAEHRKILKHPRKMNERSLFEFVQFARLLQTDLRMPRMREGSGNPAGSGMNMQSP